MATNLLDSLTPAQLDELATLLESRRAGRVISGKKVDYDAMTPQQLADVNKTLLPATFKTEHVVYPRMMYGLRDGQLVSVQVEDEDHELTIRERYDLNWKYSALEHGIETCPTHGDGIKPVDFQPVGGIAPLPETIAPAAFAQGAIEATRRAEKKAKAA